MHATSEADFWIRNHYRVGVVVFDRDFQQGIDEEVWMRFFVVAKFSWALFTREDVETKFVLGSLSSDVSEAATTTWIRLRGRLLPFLKRRAWCHQCKSELKLYQNPLCLKCYWIKCACGGCGCNFDPNSPFNDEMNSF